MLPTDKTVLGDFLNANDHYANHVNQFELHTPDACRRYADGMLLGTPGAREQFSSKKSPSIVVSVGNMYVWGAGWFFVFCPSSLLPIPSLEINVVGADVGLVGC